MKKKFLSKVFGIALTLACMIPFGGSKSMLDLDVKASGSDIITEDYKCSKIYGKDEVTITVYKGKGKDVVIPDEIEGYAVTQIHRNAFKERPLDSVVIPDTVYFIGTKSFNGCGLKSLTLGNSVKEIEKEAFRNNKLTEVILPDSIEKVGELAFANNSISSLKLGKSLKEIEMAAFDSNNISSLEISTTLESLEDIGTSAFSNNNLTEITIPNSVRFVSYKSFGFYDEDTESKKIENFTIKGVKDSSAHKYALENDFKFIEIDEVTPEKESQNPIESSNNSEENPSKDKSSEKDVKSDSNGFPIIPVAVGAGVVVVGVGATLLLRKSKK